MSVAGHKTTIKEKEMTDFAHTENSSLDDALAMLDNPCDMDDTEIERLTHDKDVLLAYNELLDCRQAVQEKYGERRFDADSAWERFGAKTAKNNDKTGKRARNRHMLIGGVIGIAATLLLLFCFSLFKKAGYTMPDGVVVYKADDSSQAISLYANGDNMPLDDINRLTTIDGAKPTITGKRLSALDYTKAVKATVSNHSLTTPRGKDFELILSDGTHVWLNADSKIDYPAKFDGGKRIVRLQGEAFFEVAKDNEHPFIVQAKNFETKVLGTVFNVRSYSDEDSHITLIDGSVEVRNTRANGSSMVLSPGDDARLMQDGSIETRKVDVDSYVYWKEGFFYFDNVSMVDIMQSLGRWYNVNVIFTNREAMKYKLHFLCDRNGGVEHAVMLLNRMGKGSIHFDGKTIVVD